MIKLESIIIYLLVFAIILTGVQAIWLSLGLTGLMCGLVFVLGLGMLGLAAMIVWMIHNP